MTTMMEHPKHGRHPAVGHEVENMKAHGWTIMPPKVKEAAGLASGGKADEQLKTHVSEPFVVATHEAAEPRRRGPNKRKG